MSIFFLFLITVLAPIVMNYADRRNLLRNMKWMAGPVQMAICGVCLTFATPLCCALFAQKVKVEVSSLEEDVQKEIRSKYGNLDVVYYNKGL